MPLILINLPSDHVSFPVPQFSHGHSTGNNTESYWTCMDVEMEL